MKYNTRKYNAQRYNINGTYFASSFSETMTETDGAQIASLLKALSDSLAFTSTIALTPALFLTDFVFFDDFIQIQFSNKALNDTIRLADWVSIERKPFHNEWFD